jgi:signal transduction histidine kinase
MIGGTHSRWRVGRADLAIALFLLVLGQLEVALRGVDGGDELVAHLVWAAVAAAALVRRSRPLVFALAAIVVVAARYRYGLTPTGGAVYAIVTPLALYGLGAYGRDPLRSAALAVLAVILVEAVTAAIALAGHGPLAHAGAADWLGQLSIYLAAAGGGIALRDRTEVLRAARRRAAAAPSPEDAVDDALLEERARIARELHAVVSASVRELLDAAERAREPLRSAPERARAAIESAREACTRAMAEMRRMLSLLRGEPERVPHEPAAGAAPEPADPLPLALARIPEPVRAQGLPLLVLVVGVLEALMTYDEPLIYGSAGLALRLAGAVALAAAFLPRRRLPLVTAAGVVAVIIVRVVALDDFFTLNLSLYIAAFVAGAYGRPFAVAVIGGLVVIAGGLSTPALAGVELPFGAYLFAVITIAAAWTTGVGGRRRLAEAEELRALAAEERRRSELAVERAVAEERLRVARELHDLVGHGLTSIILQCAGAERLVATSPEQASAAIDAVEVVGQEVEIELGELLSALHGRGEAETPRLSRLPRLVEGAESAGMEVELELEGDLDLVPAGQGAAAYRIAQEGLTNARKHGGAAATVRVAAGEGSLTITIENPVVDVGAGEAVGSGHGLIGISERVRVYDGRFEAGATPAGSWTVRAELPLEEAAPTVVASAR